MTGQGSLNPDPIDAISIHAYGEDAERIAWSVRAAKSIKKPLFIGEFGVPGAGPEVEKEFRRMLRSIEESPVPLSALWVFDLPSQNADYNITADNEWSLPTPRSRRSQRPCAKRRDGEVSNLLCKSFMSMGKDSPSKIP